MKITLDVPKNDPRVLLLQLDQRLLTLQGRLDDFDEASAWESERTREEYEALWPVRQAVGVLHIAMEQIANQIIGDAMLDPMQSLVEQLKAFVDELTELETADMPAMTDDDWANLHLVDLEGLSGVGWRHMSGGEGFLVSCAPLPGRKFEAWSNGLRISFSVEGRSTHLYVVDIPFFDVEWREVKQ